MYRSLSYSLVHLASCLITISQGQAGSTLPLITVFLAALIGITALMIDGTRLSVTANEVQTGADIAATAGAMALLLNRAISSDASAALSGNQLDGSTPTMSSVQTLEIGNWSSEGVFTPNLFPSNAVRVTVTKPVDNILMGRLDPGSRNSVVSKTATAAFRGLGTGQATLPLVIGDCKFTRDCFDASCLPRMTQVPDVADNSAWTGFYGSSSQSAVSDLFESPCGVSTSSPTITVGSFINIANGQMEPLLEKVDCLINRLQKRTHVIPVVPCVPQYNQTQPVLGFATVVIDSVRSKGSDKGISLHAIFSALQPGSSGGGNYGTGSIALVQ